MGPQDLSLSTGAVGVVGTWGKEEPGREGGEETGESTALPEQQLVLVELDPVLEPPPRTP